MRVVLALTLLGMLSACAPYVNPDAEASSYDRRTTTGSNIPRRGSAVVVDRQQVEEQLSRQNGSLQR